MQIYKKKWRKNPVLLLKFTFIFFILTFGLFSCYKKKDTLILVYVRDHVGAIVQGAKVEVFAEPTDTSNYNTIAVKFEEITDETGTATFNLNSIYESGQTGVAILKAKATYYSKTGQTIIQVVEEVNNECFIEIE